MRLLYDFAPNPDYDRTRNCIIREQLTSFVARRDRLHRSCKKPNVAAGLLRTPFRRNLDKGVDGVLFGEKVEIGDKYKALEGCADHVSGWMQIRDEWLKRTGSRFDGGYVFVDSFSQVVKIKMWKWFFTIHDAIRYPLRILDEVTEGGGFDVERSWFEHSLGHNKKAQTLTWTACLVEKGHPTIQIELSRHNQAWCNVIVVAVKE